MALTCTVDPTSLLLLLASGQLVDISERFDVCFSVQPAIRKRHLEPIWLEDRHTSLQISFNQLCRLKRVLSETLSPAPEQVWHLAKHLGTPTGILVSSAIEAGNILVTDDVRTLRVVQTHHSEVPLITGLSLLREWFEEAEASYKSQLDTMRTVSYWFRPLRSHPEFEWWQTVDSQVGTS